MRSVYKLLFAVTGCMALLGCATYRSLDNSLYIAQNQGNAGMQTAYNWLGYPDAIVTEEGVISYIWGNAGLYMGQHVEDSLHISEVKIATANTGVAKRENCMIVIRRNKETGEISDYSYIGGYWDCGFYKKRAKQFCMQYVQAHPEKEWRCEYGLNRVKNAGQPKAKYFNSSIE